MCLAIPGKVISIDTTSSPVMGIVDFGGVRKRICLEWIDEVRPGEYVIVHVGFAIARLDEREAERTLSLFEEAAEAKRAEEEGNEVH